MHKALAALAAALAVVAALPASQSTVFVLERLNGTYSQLGRELREIRNGPVTVRPTSSASTMELLANRLELTPLGEDQHLADLWVRFQGEADVQAEILVGGFSGGVLTDQVTVPDQERTVRSRIRLERQEDDYLITVVEPPSELSIQIRSRLAGQLVSICEGLTRFTFGSNCEGLDAALSNPRIPMPEPGEEFVLDAGELTAEERQRFEDYLAATAGE